MLQRSKPSTIISRELNRLCARLVQILDYSVVRATDSLLLGKGLELQHNRFKKDLNAIINRQKVSLDKFLTVVWGYVRGKYYVQIDKVRRYTAHIETGDDVYLRSFFQHENIGKTEDPPPIPSSNKARSPKKQSRLSNTKSRQKSKPKQFLENHSEVEIKTSTPAHDKKDIKHRTAFKLLRHYNLLQLSRKQFLEDMMFGEEEQQGHQRKVFYNLWERNKGNKDQIKEFIKEIESVHNIQKVLAKRAEKLSKNEEHDNSCNQDSLGVSLNVNSSRGDKSIQRNTFVISRVKHRRDFSHNHSIPLRQTKMLIEQNSSEIQMSSIKLRSTGPDPNQIPQALPEQPVPQRLQKSSLKVRSEDKRTSKNRNQRIYVIKSPILFQDEGLFKESAIKARKYEPMAMRFKKKNNQCQCPSQRSQVGSEKGNSFLKFNF